MTNHPNQKAYEERQRERGRVKVELWVPAERREAIREVARKMREGEK